MASKYAQTFLTLSPKDFRGSEKYLTVFLFPVQKSQYIRVFLEG
jgi:hypothetical protein